MARANVSPEVEVAMRRFLNALPGESHDHTRGRRRPQPTWEEWDHDLQFLQNLIHQKFLPAEDSECDIVDERNEDARLDGEGVNEMAYQEATKVTEYIFLWFNRRLDNVMGMPEGDGGVSNREKKGLTRFLRFLFLGTVGVLLADYPQRVDLVEDESHIEYRRLARDAVRDYIIRCGSTAALATDDAIDRNLKAARFGIELLVKVARVAGDWVHLIPFSSRNFMALLQKKSYGGARDYIEAKLKDELRARAKHRVSTCCSMDPRVISMVSLISHTVQSSRLNGIQVAQRLGIVGSCRVTTPIVPPFSSFVDDTLATWPSVSRNF